MYETLFEEDVVVPVDVMMENVTSRCRLVTSREIGDRLVRRVEEIVMREVSDDEL